jgi:hypothetical protein
MDRTTRNKILQELGDEELRALYARVFNTDDGQLVLEDLRNRCFIYIPTIANTDRDTFSNEGKRAIVLTIESRLLPKPVTVKQEE